MTGTIPKKEFSPEVQSVSPQFVEIFHQAYQAERHGLDQVCGMGYRKALEFLLKDFVKSENPHEVSRIEAMPLAQCIRTYITDRGIREMAERAVWLGNDETHYVRVWTNLDTGDLKQLLDIVVQLVELTEKRRKYSAAMQRTP